MAGKELKPVKRYLNEREVSEMTGLSLTTLRRDRSMGRGIPYVKFRRMVRYELQEVENFMQRHRVRTIDTRD